MKIILIMRHAKSDWNADSSSDFDRPLNKRGQKAAPYMGKVIKDKGLVPDVVISSPAVRAKQTAMAVTENCGFKGEIIWNRDFYFGDIKDVISAISNLDENDKSVIVFGHNPTWSYLADYLSGEYISMATADIVVLKFDNEWSHLSKNTCEFIEQLKPRNLM